MRFAHSFWSKPLKYKKFNEEKEALSNIVIDYATSAACIKNLGYEINLYCDKDGYEILKFIPYTNFIIIDNLYDESIHFAAQIKFEALKRMQLDEILIDGDLFLRKKEALNHFGTDEDVICTCFEPLEFITNISVGWDPKKYYDKMHDKMKEIPFKETYHSVDFEHLEGWPNTSFLKFNNQNLKDEYIEQYQYHKNLMKDIDFEETWPDIYIEQYFLKLLIESKNYKPKYIIENFFIDSSFNKFALDIGFTHLGAGKGSYKEFALQILEEKDENLFNEVNKIIN